MNNMTANSYTDLAISLKGLSEYDWVQSLGTVPFSEDN